MKIEFTRGRDKNDVLTITRTDGSRTWQHQHPGMPLHDLTHLAVETTLELTNGFYGVVRQGLDITRLTERDIRKVLPPEGIWTEYVVGLIQSERLSTEPLTGDEFNDLLERELAHAGIEHRRRINAEELERIRELFARLATRWHQLQPGETLALEFATSQEGQRQT